MDKIKKVQYGEADKYHQHDILTRASYVTGSQCCKSIRSINWSSLANYCRWQVTLKVLQIEGSELEKLQFSTPKNALHFQKFL